MSNTLETAAGVAPAITDTPVKDTIISNPTLLDTASQLATGATPPAVDPSQSLHHVTLMPWEFFFQADSVVKAVIIVLVFASVWCWAIIFGKSLRLGRLNKRADALLGSLRAGATLADLGERFKETPKDPFVSVYRSLVDEYYRSRDHGLDEGEANKDSLKDRVHRVGQISTGIELEQLNRGTQGLATIGSVAPFVGLFGTVWGIINAFQGIAASGNTSLAVVAPGIAEALFVTALGLVAAVPAVIAYNRISGNVSRYAKRLNTFVGIFEVELSRQLAAGRQSDGRAAA